MKVNLEGRGWDWAPPLERSALIWVEMLSSLASLREDLK